MALPEKPARNWLDVGMTGLAGLAGLGLLGYLGVVTLLIAVSPPDLSRRELQAMAPAWTTTTGMVYHPLAMRVQVIDAQGRVQQRPPVAALLALPEAEVTLSGVGQRLVRRYWDYR